MSHRKSSSSSKPRSTEREMLFGTHAVLAALTNPQRTCYSLWATQNAANRHAEELSRSTLSPTIVSARELDRKTSATTVHQGLVLQATPLPPVTLEDLNASAPLLILDQVTDPQNVGAILRSCAVFGVEAVIMTSRNAPPLTGTVAKAASGALECVSVIKVTNLARSLEELEAKGYQLIGLDGEAEQSLNAFVPAPPFALVMGAEGKGLRQLTQKHCHHLVRIEARGAIASLNVSNAAAVALFAITNQNA